MTKIYNSFHQLVGTMPLSLSLSDYLILNEQFKMSLYIKSKALCSRHKKMAGRRGVEKAYRYASKKFQLNARLLLEGTSFCKMKSGEHCPIPWTGLSRVLSVSKRGCCTSCVTGFTCWGWWFLLRHPPGYCQISPDMGQGLITTFIFFTLSTGGDLVQLWWGGVPC